MFGLGTPELLVIVVIIVILFGASRIPEIGRALGQARREIKAIQQEIVKPVQDIKDTLEQTLPLTEPPLLVFVSSVMNPLCEDLKPERAAAKKAIEAFPPLTRAWRFEDSPASPEGAERAYLKKVKQCDIFVLVVGKDITRPVLKEYATAKCNDKLCLVFLKKGLRDAVTDAFIHKVRSHVKYAEFETDLDLDYQIWRSVATLLIESVRKLKLSANDVAALTLFVNELPKLESPKARLEISESAQPETEQIESGTHVKIGRDGKRMILIPAGWFWRGTSEADILDMLVRFKAERRWFENETRQHSIYLDAYYIDETPVTNAEYKRFLDAHLGHRAPYGWDEVRRTYPTGKANHPVVNVAWAEANEYARWVGKRLPTEAQWEKAARGTDGRRYPWGNADPNATRCNFNKNESGTTSVGKYSPRGNSPYGVMDMAGNVWEWVNDWYDGSYYSSSPRENPQGPSTGQYRVLRGGSFDNNQNDVRAASRYDDAPALRHPAIGFRCAQ